VAAFLFLSGYFVDTVRVASHPYGWVKTRFVRLVIPYIVWSLVYSGINITQNPSVPIWHRVLSLFIGSAAAQLYFIVVLVQLTILTPILTKLVLGRWRFIGLLVSPTYVIVYIYVYVILFHRGLPPLYGTLCCAWFIFYYLGIWTRVRKQQKPISTKKVLCIMLFALVVAMVEAYAWIFCGAPFSLAISQVKITSLFYSLSVILFFFTWHRYPLHKNRLLSLLERIGDLSYGIYYVHMVWLVALQTLVVMNSRVSEIINGIPLPLIQIAQILCSLILSIITIMIARKIFGRKLATRVFGF